MTNVKHKYWLVSTFEIDNIDEIAETATVKVFTKWWWRSHEKLIVQKGGETEIFQNENTISEYCPVNPMLPFSNIIGGKPEIMDSLWRASSTKHPYHSSSSTTTTTTKEEDEEEGEGEGEGEGEYLNYTQKVYILTLRADMNMKYYPFDRQIIPAIVSRRKWKGRRVDGSYDGTKHEWVLYDRIPPSDWFVREPYPEDKNVVNLKTLRSDRSDALKRVGTMLRYSSPKKNISNEKMSKKDDKPVLCLKLQRDPTFARMNIITPTFIIIAIVLLSMFASQGGGGGAEVGGSQVSAIATGLLTIVANRLALVERMPKKSYGTIATHYLDLSTWFLLLLALKVAWQTYFQPEFNEVDNLYDWACWSDMVFCVIWILPHTILIGPLLIMIQNLSFLDWADVEIPSEKWLD